MTTRADVATYVRETLGALYLKAGRATDDSVDGFKIPIDETWRTLSLSLGETTFDDALTTAAYSLAKAYSYRLVMGWLATKYSKSVSNPSTRIDTFQMFQAAEKLAKEAYADAVRYGYRSPDVSYDELNVSDSVERRRDIARAQAAWTEFG